MLGAKGTGVQLQMMMPTPSVRMPTQMYHGYQRTRPGDQCPHIIYRLNFIVQAVQSHQHGESDGDASVQGMKKKPAAAKLAQSTVVVKKAASKLQQAAKKASQPPKRKTAVTTIPVRGTHPHSKGAVKQASEHRAYELVENVEDVQQRIKDTPVVELPDLPLSWSEFQQQAGIPSKGKPIASKTSPNRATKQKFTSQAVKQQHSPTGFGLLSNSDTVKLFRYAASRDKLLAAISAAGLEDMVELVDEISSADVVVAVKETPAGKHVNITQGARTAANAGLPFVVLGRKINAQGLQEALQPFLPPGS